MRSSKQYAIPFFRAFCRKKRSADPAPSQISEAYQVLSNEELRKQYDMYGKARAVPDSGFGKLPKPRARDRKEVADTFAQRTRRSSSA
jgi:DnaJ-class molecular chaperone